MALENHNLNLFRDSNATVTLFDLLSKRVAVLGVSGSGKTYTVAVILEELLTSRVPMTIIDIEGEYWSLKERYQTLVVGKSDESEVAISAEHAAEFADFIYRQQIPVILDFSQTDEAEQFTFLDAYLSKLWQIGTQEKFPYVVVFEEAHLFIPEGGNTPIKALVQQFALRGRKRGFCAIVASQRPQNVAKTFLSQAELCFLQRATGVHAIDAYAGMLPMTKAEIKALAPSLENGEAILLNNNRTERVRIRERHTYHPSSNPIFSKPFEGKLIKIDTKLLSELAATFKPVETQKPSGTIAQEFIAELDTQIKNRDATIKQLEARVKELEAEVARLKNLPTKIEKADLKVKSANVREVTTVTTVKERTETVTQAAYSRVEFSRFEAKRFTQLLNSLAQTKLFQRTVLAIILKNPNTGFTAFDLAAQTGYSQATLIAKEFTFFLKESLIFRDGKGNDAIYRSNLPSYVAAKYPGLDADMFQKRLIAALPEVQR